MKQFFDIYGDREYPSVILKDVEENNIDLITHAKDLHPVMCFNGTSTLSFTIEDRVEDGEVPYYDAIQMKSRIFVDELDTMFVVTECAETTRGEVRTKNVSCVSLENEDFNKPVTIRAGLYSLFDPLKQDESLLHIVMKQIPEWKIDGVDAELLTKKYRFEDNTLTAYQFLLGEVEDKFECVFFFNSKSKTVKVTTNENSGKDANIVLKMSSVVQDVTKTPDNSKFTTAFEVRGSNNMSISRANPLGTNIIYNFTGVYNMMSNALRVKVELWQKRIDENQKQYATILTALNGKYSELNNAESQLKTVQNYMAGIWEAMSLHVKNGTTDTAEYKDLQKRYRLYQDGELEWKSKIRGIQLQIDGINADLKVINDLLSLTNNFTTNEIIMLSRYTYIAQVVDENYIQNDNMSQSEIQDVAQKLYDKYIKLLAKQSGELVALEVTVDNFIFDKDMYEYTKKLKLGDNITVDMGGDKYATSKLLVIDWNYDDRKSMTIQVADGLKPFGDKYEIAEKKIHKNIMDNTLKGEIAGFLEASDNNSKVSTMMKEGLAANLTEIKSNENNEFRIDGTGAVMRKYDPETDTYSPEQIWLAYNQIVITDDAFETIKLCLGKLLYPDGTTMGFGLSTEILIGRILIGEKCIIQTGDTFVTIDGDGIKVENGHIFIKDKNGNAFIDGEKITLGDGKVGLSTAKTLQDGGNVMIYAGASSYDLRDVALFRVYDDGKVVMMNAEVHGSVIVPNAGISGDGDLETSVRLWVGNDDRTKAPTRGLHDGTFYTEKLVAAKSVTVGGKEVLTANENINALTMDNMHLATSFTSNMIQANTVFGKAFFVEQLQTNFSDWILGYNEETTRCYAKMENAQTTYILDELSLTEHENMVINENILCYNRLYGDEWQDWYVLTNPILKAMQWQPNIFYEQNTVLLHDTSFYVVTTTTYPKTGYKTWEEAIAGLLLLQVTEESFYVKLKKKLNRHIKMEQGFDLNNKFAEPYLSFGEGSTGVSDVGKCKLHKQQNQFVQEYYRLNGKKSGFVLDEQGTKYYDKDGVLKEVGSGGGSNIFTFDHVPTEAELDAAGVPEGGIVLIEQSV